MVCGGGSLGRQLVYKDGALMNGNCAPVRDILESSLTLSTTSGHSKKIPVYEPEVGSHQTLDLLAPCFLDFSALQHCEK